MSFQELADEAFPDLLYKTSRRRNAGRDDVPNPMRQLLLRQMLPE